MEMIFFCFLFVLKKKVADRKMKHTHYPTKTIEKKKKKFIYTKIKALKVIISYV